VNTTVTQRHFRKQANALAMIQIYVYGDRLLSGSNRGYQFPVFNWIKVT